MARDKDEAINSYITDMLSLEEHIHKAVSGVSGLGLRTTLLPARRGAKIFQRLICTGKL